MLHPLPRLDFVAQYLRGKALVRDTSNDSSMRAFYALLSHHYRAHRFTVRYDEFRVNDLDGGNSTAERRRRHGRLSFEWGLRHRVASNTLVQQRSSGQRAEPEPSQDGWQLSYRFRY